MQCLVNVGGGAQSDFLSSILRSCGGPPSSCTNATSPQQHETTAGLRLGPFPRSPGQAVDGARNYRSGGATGTPRWSTVLHLILFHCSVVPSSQASRGDVCVRASDEISLPWPARSGPLEGRQTAIANRVSRGACIMSYEANASVRSH
jgi:hypothetical protein